MAQPQLFDAIETQNIESLNQIIANGVDLNVLSRRGTPLYCAVKLHNFEIVQLLVHHGADGNIVQLDFDPHRQRLNDGLPHACVISTPIDLLCEENNTEHDEILRYLLENRTMVNKDMIEQRIYYCQRLFDSENHEALFDYVTSCFLRTNIYNHFYPLGDTVALTMIMATFNIVANFEGQQLSDGGTHEAFLALVIRSLFEELVRFQLDKAFNIQSEEQYAHILRELIHNLEAYNLLMDINRIPNERAELFYPSIAKNIIKKLKQMKDKAEYTLPMKFEAHALCLNFVREPNSIVIRIDNLHIAQTETLPMVTNIRGQFVRIPKIIGEISLDHLDQIENYFISLLTCMKKCYVTKADGIETLCRNQELKNLDTNHVDEMTEKLIELTNTFNYFIVQAQNNCFCKSYEPGFAIRSDTNKKIFEKALTIPRVYATRLAEGTNDIIGKREEFDNTLLYYWNNEPTIKFNAEYMAQLHQHIVVWVDSHIGESGNNEQMKKCFRRIVSPLYFFTTAAEAIDFIRTQQDNNVPVFLIVSGSLAKDTVLPVFNFQCVIKIYIFCVDLEKYFYLSILDVYRLKIFNSDEDLLVELTKNIAIYLVDVAKEKKSNNDMERAAGLLDWADWLYHDATTREQVWYQSFHRQIRPIRQNLHINHQINPPN